MELLTNLQNISPYQKRPISREQTVPPTVSEQESSSTVSPIALRVATRAHFRTSRAWTCAAWK